MIGKKTSYNIIPWMWSDQFDLNLQLTGICSDYEATAKRGSTLEEGIIYFFLKNRKIMGACGLGVGGKIGRDIRLAGKLSEKKIKVTKEILSDKNNKLNKI
jgi:3-phenylpropionate/trans-cinnamate dioxygenase ferredoxin reductase subunit